MIFAIPRGEKIYVGTTDTDYEGDIAHPIVTKDDRDYLLAAANFMFPTLKLTKEDVESSWAGLRPLIAEGGKNPDEISRKDEIFVSDSGLYSMAVGKLTGYRKMAEEVVDRVVEEIKTEEGVLYSQSETLNLPLSGGDIGGVNEFPRFKERKLKEGKAKGIDQKELQFLIQTYGSNVDIIYRMYEKNKETAEKDDIDPVVLAMLLYAIDYEQTYTPADFFIRRTGALFFDINWVNEHKEAVILFMKKTLQWNENLTKQYTNELNQLINEAKNAK